MKALGLIETRGVTGAIIALDVALKTAQVELLSKQKIRGGIATIEFQGDVDAVKSAVEAGAATAEKLGVLLSSHVIARPDVSIEKILLNKDIKSQIIKEEKEIEKLREVKDKQSEEITEKSDNILKIKKSKTKRNKK